MHWSRNDLYCKTVSLNVIFSVFFLLLGTEAKYDLFSQRRARVRLNTSLALHPCFLVPTLF